MTNHLRK